MDFSQNSRGPGPQPSNVRRWMRPASEAPSPWLAALLATASPAGITRAGIRPPSCAALASLLYGSPTLLQVTLGTDSQGTVATGQEAGGPDTALASTSPCSQDTPQGQLPLRWGLCVLSLGLTATPSGIPGPGFTGRGGHLRTEGSGFFTQGPFCPTPPRCPSLPAPRLQVSLCLPPGPPPGRPSRARPAPSS